MTTIIPDSHHDLFTKPLVASFITVSPEGHPQATVVWCRLNGTHIQVSITMDTQKYKNILANPHVSLIIVDSNDPYRYIEVRGTATLSTGNASEIIMDIARKYGRHDFDVQRLAHIRTIVTITPTKVLSHGS